MTKGKTVAVNRKARYNYEILDTLEAGLVLTGTEIKAIREGRANLSGGLCEGGRGRVLARQRSHRTLLCGKPQ